MKKWILWCLGVGLTALSVIFSGCAASSYTTRAYPTVAKPSPASTDYTEWLNFYTDQFHVNGDNVDPPGADYPEVAKKAYMDAKLQWDQYVATIRKGEQREIQWWVIGGAISLISTLLLLGAL
jgi:hypothetical protein